MIRWEFNRIQTDISIEFEINFLLRQLVNWTRAPMYFWNFSGIEGQFNMHLKQIENNRIDCLLLNEWIINGIIKKATVDKSWLCKKNSSAFQIRDSWVRHVEPRRYKGEHWLVGIMQSQIILMLSSLYDSWCDLSFALSSPALPVNPVGAHQTWLTQHSALHLTWKYEREEKMNLGFSIFNVKINYLLKFLSVVLPN